MDIKKSKKRLHAVDTKTALPLQEEAILAFWQEEHIFEQTIGTAPSAEEDFSKRPLFSFYDGPPFATGLPHYGHLLAGSIKDIIARYKTMKGFFVPRRMGWDCHGLPVENEIEKAHNLSGAHSIEAFGIGRFNEECRNIVLRYTEEWKSIVSRFGRWADFSQTYKTMDRSFMESVWWVFSELHKKGLVYKGYKVMPFSTKLGTPLSNFEASENYKEVDDPSLVVTFPLENAPHRSLMVWTTTPWTLVANLAIAVGPDIDYLVVRKNGEIEEYIIAKDRIASIFGECDYEVVEELKGQRLAKLSYTPLFSYFAELKKDGAFQVLADSFVSTQDGTGLVHLAPGFGEDDFYACQRAGVPIVCPVDQNGFYTAEIAEYKGRHVKECDKDLIRELKKQGRVFSHTTFRHRYPFCWRSDTPLIYKAVSTWFVAVEKVKDKILLANENITWMPRHIKHGRFGKWLENARDWAVSRNRYWGTPIPIWEAEDGEQLVLGSVALLEELSGMQVDDIHRHHIDQIEIKKNGKTFRRIPEVFDCWFESGSMPYAQQHYPFEQKESFSKSFPADFIAEGLDQTRGWFYTLTVLSAALFDSEAFKNVIVNGIVLAEDGAKMSKRLKNYPDPMDMVHKYGADAVRMYLFSSPAVQADDLCFSESGVELTLRQLFIPLLNSLSFYATYADIYGFDQEDPAQWVAVLKNPPQAELDRWILSKTGSFICTVEKAMDNYDLQMATQQFPPFIEMLTNWYIRRSRRRFWSDENSQDRREAFSVLASVLKNVALVVAPFAPFFSELMWKCLRTSKDPISVHLAQAANASEFVCDKELEAAHDTAQIIARLAHALRKQLKLRVRQPLRTLYIVTKDPSVRRSIEKTMDILLDEVNVKALEIESDEHLFVHLVAKPNFRVVGKKVGKKMKALQEAVAGLTEKEILSFVESGEGATLSLLVEGEPLLLTQEDIAIERVVKEGVVAHHDAGLTVALDTHLSEELVAEGLAREVVNKLNTMRRERDFHVSDRIHVTAMMSQESQKRILPWLPYIQEETLALTFIFGDASGRASSQEWEIGGEQVVIDMVKAS